MNTQKYFTLVSIENGLYVAQFGDYDRSTVAQEKKDSFYGIKTKIISSLNSQESVNEAIKALNIKEGLLVEEVQEKSNESVNAENITVIIFRTSEGKRGLNYSRFYNKRSGELYSVRSCKEDFNKIMEVAKEKALNIDIKEEVKFTVYSFTFKKLKQ